MRHEAGFSLIELMTVLAIMAVVMVIAGPSAMEMVDNNRMITSSNNFVMAINMARSEAVKRNQTVVLCPSSNGVECLENSAWEQGWLVYAEVDGNSGIDTSATPADVILRQFQQLPRGIQLRAGDGTKSYAERVTYRSIGRPTAYGDFVLCDSRGIDFARVVTITHAGQPRTVRNSERQPRPPFTDCDGSR